MPTSQHYTVTLLQNGVAFQYKVSKEAGKKIIAFIKRSAQTQANTPPRHIAGVELPLRRKPLPEEVKNSSLRRFLDRCDNAKRYPDKITVIGYYLKTYRGKETFTRKDVVKGLEDIGEDLPGYILRDLKWTMKIGWIAPVENEKNTYSVTEAGITVVRENFPRRMVKNTKVDNNWGKKAVKKRAARKGVKRR